MSLGALALLALFIAWTVPSALTLVCIATFVGLSIAAVAIEVRARRVDRFNLERLRVLHESGGAAPQEEESEVAEDAGIVCPHCGTIYAAWLLVCPNCGR